MKSLYLKPNVVIEPLYDRWYAWSHLISPATAAMNIVGRHLKIMNSYLQAPQIHAAAVKNPKMLGGPFMDLKGGRVNEVKQLVNDTVEKQKELLSFCESIKELDRMLKHEAKGFSLESLYASIPEELKGYVELVYDLNNNASFRFFESLLYKSKFYNESSQSIALWVTQNDERPFALSTPKLDDDNVIHLNIPFNSPAIDALAKMKRIPGEINVIKEMIDLNPEQEELFDSMFTETPPTAYEKYEGDKIRMRYFGHACILVETKDVSILVDPLISYYGYQSDVARFSDMDLPEVIDYVLITHNHQDHILFETLLPLRHKIRNLVVPRTSGGALQDPNLKLMFNKIGFENVIEIGEMETINFKDCQITGIPFIGEHCDLNIQAKICHHVNVGDFSILFAADSCNVAPELYQHIQKEIGDLDVVFLGMECDGAPLTWLYGPLLTEELSRDKDSSRRLAGSNFERGMDLVNIFNPKEVYVYAMGMEPWLEFISSIKYTDASHPIVASNKLIEQWRMKGGIAERLYGEKELLYNKSIAFVESAI
ncbi:polyketide synthase [Pedobacter lusitanus]|uniref:Polyketide synthase n=1 Tax=Pedobacter lusitanus TaxID=1503925 RepID=A0A0D0GFJ6_9SPHI|nr:MBL fold metallo-hydrolase [Pedobacter lusitanus]KIO74905.1 polyketide synthase [Pedobacter lusitanus]